MGWIKHAECSLIDVAPLSNFLNCLDYPLCPLWIRLFDSLEKFEIVFQCLNGIIVKADACSFTTTYIPLFHQFSDSDFRASWSMIAYASLDHGSNRPIHPLLVHNFLQCGSARIIYVAFSLFFPSSQFCTPKNQLTILVNTGNRATPLSVV